VRSNRLSQSPLGFATPHRRRARSYPQVGPAGNDRFTSEPVYDDELSATRRPGDDPDVPFRHPELVGKQADESGVRRSLDRRRRHPDAELAFDDALDMVGCRTRSDSDGEPRVGGRQALTIARMSVPRTSRTMRALKSNIPD
jgi:hypothetical protein